TGFKWLNLLEFCRKLLPSDSIDRIKYFTARVDARVDDPDQPLRQMRYWRALRTLGCVEIIQGHFLTAPKKMPSLASTRRIEQLAGQGCDVRGLRPDLVEVLRSEEKGTDVNLAAHLVNDAHRNRFEAALVVSNDSDLKEAIRIARREVGKVVGVFTPHRDRPSVQLRKTASFFREIPIRALRESLFPDELVDARGAFRKPPGW
ncbi:MAG: NYN domain-containing protein, partial [Thermoanaerobaculia bacterium]